MFRRTRPVAGFDQRPASQHFVGALPDHRLSARQALVAVRPVIGAAVQGRVGTSSAYAHSTDADRNAAVVAVDGVFDDHCHQICR